MRTRGWVIKNGDTEWWRDEDSTFTSEKKDARVFLTRACAFAARDAQCSVGCCQVYRLTSRRRAK